MSEPTVHHSLSAARRYRGRTLIAASVVSALAGAAGGAAVAVVADADDIPQPRPTPTPTDGPSATPSPSPTQSAEPTATPEPAASPDAADDHSADLLVAWHTATYSRLLADVASQGARSSNPKIVEAAAQAGPLHETHARVAKEHHDRLHAAGADEHDIVVTDADIAAAAELQQLVGTLPDLSGPELDVSWYEMYSHLTALVPAAAERHAARGDINDEPLARSVEQILDQLDARPALRPEDLGLESPQASGALGLPEGVALPARFRLEAAPATERTENAMPPSRAVRAGSHLAAATQLADCRPAAAVGARSLRLA